VSQYPHDLEAEKSAIGAVLVRSDALLEVSWLQPEHFYRDAHQCIWKAMLEMAQRAESVDLVTLAASLRRADAFDRVGGTAYITSLIDGLPRSTNIAHYADQVRETWLLRRLMTAGGTLATEAAEPGAEAKALLARAEGEILSLGQNAMRGDLVPAADSIGQVHARLEMLLETKTGVTGIATGLADLDRMTRGLQKGALTVLAARPSMGKTALALNIAAHVARTTGPVAVFSLEMTRDELLLREVIAEARVSANRVLGGYLNQDEYAAISSALGAVGSWPIWIDDAADTTVLEMRSKARRLQHRAGLALVVVDYLQLMGDDGRGRRAENRTQEVSALTRGFKALAKELQVPVLLLSQLNRGPESRADKRPNLSDLRESGAIEQDADLVVMLYRDEYYNPHSSDVGVAEAIIAKARNGPTGTVRLAFIAEQTRFANLEGR
jgi:replicative DNA helicase